MPNLLQYRTVQEIVSQYASLYGLPDHKAFLFLVIEKFLGHLELNSIDIEESIVDGGDDCGIDAIVIDEESEVRPHIYFFQSKYSPKENAIEKNFEGEALDKIQSAVNDFVLHGTIDSRFQNHRLVDKLRSVKNLSTQNPKYTLVFCSNTKQPSDTAKARLESFIHKTNASVSGNYLAVEYLHLDRISRELIAPQQKKKIDLQLQISGRYLSEDTGDVRLFVGAAEAKDLAALVETHGPDLFERNVRGYLQGGNQVNKGILSTAAGEDSPYFIYMNNGLTITCDKYTHAPVGSSPNLDIRNAQIVNGQQTVRSLHQAAKSKKLKDDVKVLVRIVETEKPGLLMQIVEATNSQTKVTSRDLHSNDPIQKLIEQNLAAKGYFYEARVNKYRGKESSKRVDAEVAAQSYYAVMEEQPALAKDKKKLLFGDKYEEIFSDDLNPADILYCFLLVREVQKMNNEKDYADRFSFLKDATLHTASLMHRHCLSDDKVARLDLGDTKTVCECYVAALEALRVVVKGRAEREGDKYEHRRTFKDPETYGAAVQVMIGV